MIKPQLINDNCLEVIPTLPDKSIDIVLTDPPYGISYKSNRSKAHNNVAKKGIMNDGQDEAFQLLDDVCRALKPKLKDDAHLYFFCSWGVFSDFERIIGEHFTIKTPIVWDKKNKGPGDLTYDWGNATEIAIYAIHGKKPINFRRDNVISVSRVHHSKMIHPTEKPVELLRTILDVSAKPGDVVIDPFMGSGSTIRAASGKGLEAIGIEMDPEYFRLADGAMAPQIELF